MKNFYKITRALVAEKNFFKITRALAAEKHFKLFYLLIALMASTTFAWADANGTCGTNLTWSYVESTHTLTITGTGAMTDYEWGTSPWFDYRSSITSISLPDGLTHIGNWAFLFCTALTSVVIPAGVTSIGDEAFQYCTGLTSIDIPAGVTSIGVEAFGGCSGLTAVTIPASVTSIGERAFSGCTSLESINIPVGVTSIGSNAFVNCTSLTTVTFATGSPLTSIPADAFYQCTSLESINIPAGVTSIGKSAFYKCTGVTSITVEDGNTIYDSRNNCNAIIETASNKLIVGCRNTVIPATVTSIGEGAFQFCTGLTSIDIPATVTSIEDDAFSSCSGLTSITIPAGVTSIGNSAFYECTGLTSINIPASVNSIDNSAFADCTSLSDVYVNWTDLSGVATYFTVFNYIASPATLHVPYGTKAMYESAKPWNSFTTIVEMNPSGQCGDNLIWEYNPTTFALTITGSGAMYDYTYDTQPWKDYRSNITSVSLPDGLTHIGNFAFYYCTLLPSITIPSSVTSIGNYAFLYCVSLPSVTLPTGLTSIGEHAFSHSGLTSITIPSSVTSIEVWAFDECASLSSVAFADNSQLTSIGEKAFYGTALTSVTIPGSVTSLGVRAFAGCSGLADVTVNWADLSGLSVSNYAFQNIASPANLHVPDGTYAAYASTAPWSSFNIIDPNGGTCGESLYWAFNPSTGALTISGTGAMEDYTASSPAPWYSHIGDISSVVLPEGLTHIGQYAFKNFLVTSFTIPATVTSIGDYAFFSCNALTSIDIPNGVKTIGNYAFDTCEYLSSISIPSSVTTIGESAFKGCLSITSITIPSGVTSIENSTFSYCTTLSSVTIPASVTGIGNNAFEICTSLTDVYVNWTNPSGVTMGSNIFNYVTLSNVNLHVPAGSAGNYTSAPWSSFNIVETLPSGTCGANLFWEYNPSTGVLTISGTGAMTDYSNSDDIPWYDFTVDITSVVLPEGLTTIGTYAFVLFDNLTSINIPASVTGIGEAAFYYCKSLASVTFAEGSQLTSIGAGAFGACPALSSITIPTGVTSIGVDAFGGCTGLTSVTIPAGVNSIDDSAFAECTGLADMYVNWTNPGSVYLGADLFFTVDLANVNLHVPAGTKATYEAIYPWMYFNIIEPLPSGSCGDNLFWEYNPSTKTLTITGTGAMNDYNNSSNKAPWNTYKNEMTTVVIESGATTVGQYAFLQCTALTSIDIQSGVTSIGIGAFESCTGLTSINLPNTLTSIGHSTFIRCTGLTSITIPAGVTRIDSRTFYSCTGLTSITIPASVTSINSSAFNYCSALTSIIVENGNTKYDSRDNCNAIIQKSNNALIVGCKNTVIPTGVTSIGDLAFSGSAGLTSIEIQTSITSIGLYAFQECTGLTSITIPASVTIIGVNAFYLCTGLKDMYINWTDPSSVSLGSDVFRSVTTSGINLHLPFEAWGSYETADVWKDFKQVPVITAKADPEHGGVYYNTFYHSSIAYALPSGVEAYTAKRNGTDLILTKIAQAGDVLPANTAVILKSSVEQFEMTPSDASPVDVGENDLLGVDAATAAPSNCYVLSGHSSDNTVQGVGFYQFGGTLGAHKAYMVVSSGAGAPKRLRFVFDAATGVESLVRPASDVSSQKVLRDGQLIIIRNGAEYNANGQKIR